MSNIEFLFTKTKIKMKVNPEGGKLHRLEKQHIYAKIKGSSGDEALPHLQLRFLF